MASCVNACSCTATRLSLRYFPESIYGTRRSRKLYSLSYEFSSSIKGKRHAHVKRNKGHDSSDSKSWPLGLAIL
jgi:hypothetical protein